MAILEPFSSIMSRICVKSNRTLRHRDCPPLSQVANHDHTQWRKDGKSTSAPLTISSPQVIALKTSGKRSPKVQSPKAQSPNVTTISSPTLVAAAARLVNQVTASSPGTPTSSSAVASLLSAVISNPTALANQISAALSGGNGSSSPSTQLFGGWWSEYEWIDNSTAVYFC